MRALLLAALLTLSSPLTTALSADDAPWTNVSDGVRTRDLVEGEGRGAGNGSELTLHLTMRLDGGAVVESTELAGRPLTVRLGDAGLLPGLNTGLQGMKVGGTREIYIPAAMAYGKGGKGRVPPNANLVGRVRLLAARLRREAPSHPDVNGMPDASRGPLVTVAAAGSGPAAQPHSLVTVEAVVWDVDRQQVFSTFEASSPMKFVVGEGQVNEALDLAVAGMQRGEVRVVQVPESSRGPAVTMWVALEAVESARRPPDNPPEVPVDAQWTTLSSGTKYVDLQTGEGPTAMTGQKVMVEYTGWVKGGGMFDSSKLRPTPFELTLGAGQVIKGWEEGLVGMQVGTTRLLEIPHQAGYGASGAGAKIPPYATLIFLVEMVSVPE